jgi:hypothetical protein
VDAKDRVIFRENNAWGKSRLREIDLDVKVAFNNSLPLSSALAAERSCRISRANTPTEGRGASQSAAVPDHLIYWRLISVQALRMITSQRTELSSKINIYFATWTRLGLIGALRKLHGSGRELPSTCRCMGGESGSSGDLCGSRGLGLD